MKHIWILEKVDYVGYHQTRDIEKQFLFEAEPTTALIAKLITQDYPDHYGNRLTDLYTEDEILDGIKRIRGIHGNAFDWELTKTKVYKEE